MHIKKVVILLIATAILLSGCSMAQKIPEYTSDDWGLYLKNADGVNTIVDRKGEITFDYSLDKNGNVTDRNRNIVIGKENLYPFISIINIEIEDTDFTEVTLDTELRNSSVFFDSQPNFRMTGTVCRNGFFSFVICTLNLYDVTV